MMERMINNIMKILKEHVSQNNREIQYNQDEINRILSDEKRGKYQKQELDYKYELNKELLDENDDFINMQIQLTEFMEKYSHLFSGFDDDDLSFDDTDEEDELLPYFNKTISGKMTYGPAHPQFDNPVFFDELIRFYQDKEDYEMCDRLLKIKQSGL